MFDMYYSSPTNTSTASSSSGSNQFFTSQQFDTPNNKSTHSRENNNNIQSFENSSDFSLQMLNLSTDQYNNQQRSQSLPFNTFAHQKNQFPPQSCNMSQHPHNTSFNNNNNNNSNNRNDSFQNQTEVMPIKNLTDDQINLIRSIVTENTFNNTNSINNQSNPSNLQNHHQNVNPINNNNVTNNSNNQNIYSNFLQNQQQQQQHNPLQNFEFPPKQSTNPQVSNSQNNNVFSFNQSNNEHTNNVPSYNNTNTYSHNYNTMNSNNSNNNSSNNSPFNYPTSRKTSLQISYLTGNMKKLSTSSPNSANTCYSSSTGTNGRFPKETNQIQNYSFPPKNTNHNSTNSSQQSQYHEKVNQLKQQSQRRGSSSSSTVSNSTDMQTEDSTHSLRRTSFMELLTGTQDQDTNTEVNHAISVRQGQKRHSIHNQSIHQKMMQEATSNHRGKISSENQSHKNHMRKKSISSLVQKRRGSNPSQVNFELKKAVYRAINIASPTVSSPINRDTSNHGTENKAPKRKIFEI